MPEIIRLPQDKFGNAIQSLGLFEAGSHSVAAIVTSNRIGPFTGLGEIVTLTATQQCWIRFGTGSVVATAPAPPHTGGDSFYLPANVPMDLKIVPKGSTHVAVIRATVTDGVLYCSERA